MTTNGKHGSVQEMLPLEEIVEGVLCLRGGDYRAVIQAQSVTLSSKALGLGHSTGLSNTAPRFTSSSWDPSLSSAAIEREALR